MHRKKQNGHRSAIIWFTGLSGSGKSTLAHAVEKILHQSGHKTFVMDGDNIRHGLCDDLGFSKEERYENIRRVGETAKLFIEAGVIVLAAFISPYRAHREYIRGMVQQNDFIEIYCNASLEICEARDPKGSYKKARMGEITEFTGISAPYEPSKNHEITVPTGTKELNACVQQVITELIKYDITIP